MPNKKCEKCNLEWETGWTIKQTHYILFKHKGESRTEKTLCQTCYQQDQQTYLRDWERIQEYEKGKNMPKEIKGLTKCYAGKIDEIEGKVLSQEKCYHCNPWKVEPKQRKRMKKLQENRKDLHWKEKRELEALENRYGENNKNPSNSGDGGGEKNTNSSSSNSNFWEEHKGWIIGGGVILVLLVILGIIFSNKKKK